MGWGSEHQTSEAGLLTRTHLQCVPNRFENTVEMFDHLVITKTHNTYAFRGEECRSSYICCNSGIYPMLVPIDLDGQPARRAIKIGHIWSDRMLSPEGHAELRTT